MLRKVSNLLIIIYTVFILYTIASRFLWPFYQPFFTPFLTVLAFIFALDHASQTLGWRRTMLFLGITFTVSLLFESVGVATGLIFGPYHYTDELGIKFLNLVPILIPLAWIMMSYPAFVIAIRFIKFSQNLWIWRLCVASVGAAVMTAWDLAMDPLMVAGDHWVWEVQGAYFGIPIQNFWGWWLTVFVAFCIFLFIANIKPGQLSINSNQNRAFD